MSTPIRRTALVFALVCLGAGLFLVSLAPGSDSSSSSNPPMLSVCISPSGSYHCGLTTGTFTVRASTCGMPGPAEGDWDPVSVTGLASHTTPVYNGSWYQWTFQGTHPEEGTVSISGSFSFSGGWASRTEEYDVVTLTGVTASASVAATSDTVTFTASSVPSTGTLRCDTHGAVEWQYGYWTDPEQTEPASWTAMTHVSADKRQAYLDPTLSAGFYKVRARLCSASDWHESDMVTVIRVDSIAVSAPAMCSVNKTGVSIAATATALGSPVCGLTITFSSGDLTFPSGNTAVTDSSGVATISASAGSTPSSSLDASAVSASADNGLGTSVTDDDDFTIVRVNNPTPANPKILDGHLSENSLYTVVLTYTVTPAIAGVTAVFEFAPGEGGGVHSAATLEDPSASTNSSGEASVRVRSSDLRESPTVKCVYQESYGSTSVTFEGITGCSTGE